MNVFLQIVLNINFLRKMWNRMEKDRSEIRDQRSEKILHITIGFPCIIACSAYIDVFHSIFVIS